MGIVWHGIRRLATEACRPPIVWSFHVILRPRKRFVGSGTCLPVSTPAKCLMNKQSRAKLRLLIRHEGTGLSLNAEAEVLRRVPLFSKLEASTLKLLAFTSESFTFADGELLFRAGEPADSAFVILEGEVEILVADQSGLRAAFVRGQNEIIGEMGILNKMPRNASVRARGTVNALRITGDAFINLLQQNAVMALEVARQLSMRLAQTHAKYEALQSTITTSDSPAPAGE